MLFILKPMDLVQSTPVVLRPKLPASREVPDFLVTKDLPSVYVLPTKIRLVGDRRFLGYA